MGYWQTKVVPRIKKVFEKNSGKKAAAAEACKSFDDSKEDYSKVFEEKKAEFEAKVTELYDKLAAEIKALIKEPKPAGLKKHSAAVEKFLEELSSFEFPGSKPAYEASTKFGATYVSGPIFYVFEKVSTYVVVEEKKEEEVPAAEAPPAATTTEETSGTEEKKEIAVEEEKKEVAVEPVPEPEKTTEAAPAEPAKAEECAPAEPPKP
ncbi:Plasma membrane-associated cation-binding protein 1 [Heracleum sosnowskyi]|uniref:Plasma membrane-associated cation-binding protein 1 n=1 Tax=Heracleum sosnowskyi TaxID=360622 RepID=A0AAD8HN39_9APIA|nr:Plasma membrane-associated cation-binding protein 1 [Heracleum sosnowskyi]